MISRLTYHRWGEVSPNFDLSLLSRVGGWLGGWVGGVYELTLKLTSASTKVGVEVELSLAIYQELRNY